MAFPSRFMSLRKGTPGDSRFCCIMNNPKFLSPESGAMASLFLASPRLEFALLLVPEDSTCWLVFVFFLISFRLIKVRSFLMLHTEPDQTCSVYTMLVSVLCTLHPDIFLCGEYGILNLIQCSTKRIGNYPFTAYLQRQSKIAGLAR